MRRRLIAICLTLAAAASLAAAPAALAAKHAKKAAAPTITRVLPMRLGVGDTLTIKGTKFNSKASRNTVVFVAPSGRTAFSKPTKASKTKLVVTVPGAVTRLLSKNGTATVPTRFKLRVLAGSFSKFTSRRLSPVIVGAGAGGTGGTGGSNGPPGSPGNPVCNGTDYDGDLLPNTVELELGTDPCVKDTDLDGVEDGYEFKSAVDLNDDDYQNPQSSLPYPGPRPYPNPLDPSDANYDFDGDALSSLEEQKLWNYTIANGATRTLTPLTYSAGEKYSVLIRDANGRRQPTLAAAGYAKQTSFLAWATAHGYRNVFLKQVVGATFGPLPGPGASGTYGLLDMNRDGLEDPANHVSGPPPGLYFNTEVTYYDFNNNSFLSDNERDEDADGLTNYDETHGRLQPGYWASCYAQEKPYGLPYAGTDVINPDTDGDGVLDGADDQDHDDIPNVMELSRNAASGEWDAEHTCKALDSLPTPPATLHNDVYGRVNPFNPCLPDIDSRTCTLHPGFENGGAPFDGSLDWASLN